MNLKMAKRDPKARAVRGVSPPERPAPGADSNAGVLVLHESPWEEVIDPWRRALFPSKSKPGRVLVSDFASPGADYTVRVPRYSKHRAPVGLPSSPCIDGGFSCRPRRAPFFFRKLGALYGS
jgi:hypothetical protein